MDDNCAVNAITILLFGLTYPCIVFRSQVVCRRMCVCVCVCVCMCGCLHWAEYLITISENAAHKHHYNRIIVGQKSWKAILKAIYIYGPMNHWPYIQFWIVNYTNSAHTIAHAKSMHIHCAVKNSECVYIFCIERLLIKIMEYILLLLWCREYHRKNGFETVILFFCNLCVPFACTDT